MVKCKRPKKLFKLSNQAAREMCFSLNQMGFSNKQIRKTLKKSKCFVIKWSNRSNFQDEKRSGRPKKVTKSIEKKIQTYLSNPRYGTLRATKKKLSTQNVTISKETIRNVAQKVGMTHRLKPFKPLLKKVHKDKRLIFVNKHLSPKNLNIERKMIFYDESYIWTFNRPKGAWVYKGLNVCSKPKLSFTSKLMVGAFVSFKGKSSIFIFKEKEMLNSAKYESLLRLKMIPDAKKLYGSTKNFIFVQDNAPSHKTKEIKNFFESNKINYLEDFPPCSPDLNVIENIWAILKNEVSKTEPKNLLDLKKTIKKCWENIPLSLIQSTIKSWNNRLKDIKKLKGNISSY
jgi:transposase